MRKILLFSMVLFLNLMGFAQTDIALVNASFEDKGSFTKVKGWDATCSNASWTDLYDIPGWSSDTPPLDSGVEGADVARNDGSTNWAFLMKDDPMVWQVSDHTMAEGEVYTLKFRIGSTWKCTAGTGYLFYQTDAGRVMFDSLVVTDLVDGAVLVDAAFVSKSVAAGDASIGKKLGVGFANTSSDWMGLDDIRLSFTGKTAKRKPIAQNETMISVSSNTLKVTTTQNLLTALAVYDLNGKCLIRDSFNGHSYTMPLNINSGIYLIRIKNSTGVSSTKILVK